MQIPRLGTYGVRMLDAAIVVEKALKASSTKGNPIELTPDEMKEILSLAV